MEKNQEEDPLEELFTTEEEDADRKLLVEILKPFIKITPSGKILFTRDGQKVPNRTKVLTYLVASKVRKLRGIREEEVLPPREIIAETGLPSGTVHPTLRRLLKDGLISYQKGKYLVPSFKLSDVADELVKK